MTKQNIAKNTSKRGIGEEGKNDENVEERYEGKKKGENIMQKARREGYKI
jgi:hypothetical protein